MAMAMWKTFTTDDKCSAAHAVFSSLVDSCMGMGTGETHGFSVAFS